MDLTDITNSIKEWLHPGSTAMQIAPGQTVGPSVSVQGRVPIQYRPMDGRTTGEYRYNESSPFGGGTPKQTDQHITIDPTTQDFKQVYGSDVNPVIHHEVAHAILEKSPTNYDKLAEQNPAYQDIIRQLSGRVVNTAEVPAYMSEPGAAQRWNVPQSLVDVYRQHMTQQLPADVAAAYQRNLGK